MSDVRRVRGTERQGTGTGTEERRFGVALVVMAIGVIGLMATGAGCRQSASALSRDGGDAALEAGPADAPEVAQAIDGAIIDGAAASAEWIQGFAGCFPPCLEQVFEKCPLPTPSAAVFAPLCTARISDATTFAGTEKRACYVNGVSLLARTPNLGDYSATVYRPNGSKCFDTDLFSLPDAGSEIRPIRILPAEGGTPIQVVLHVGTGALDVICGGVEYHQSCPSASDVVITPLAGGYFCQTGDCKTN